MANHCFDVLCTICGNAWCVRGCGSHWKLSPKEIDSYIDFLKTTPCGFTYLKDYMHCQQEKVVAY